MKLASVVVLFNVFGSIACFGADELQQLLPVRQELEALKHEQDEMRKDVRAIRDILMGKQPPLENVFITIAGSPARGNPTANLVLVEFSDYQCPFCGAFARQVLPRLLNDYIDKGGLRLVFRDFPLQGHPLAEPAAEAAHCAGDQGKYWEAHDRLFNNQELLTKMDLLDHAVALGVNTAKFQQCLESGKYSSAVDHDLSEGEKLGVNGTPTFFFGYIDPANPSQIRAIKSLAGVEPFREFQKVIDELQNSPPTGNLTPASVQ